MADILWLGDSYGTGFQPTGGRVDPVPLQVGQLLNLSVDNQSVNASGYVESGDRFSFIQQAQNASLTGERYKYVFVMGGRNDNSDNYSAAMQLFDYIKTTWPEAVVYVAFLWDSRWRMTGVQSNNYSNLNMLTKQWGFTFWDRAWAWFTGQDVLFCYNDIHPNAAGSERFAQFIAQAFRTGVQPVGDCVLNLETTGGTEGEIHIAIHDGIAHIGGRWSAWPDGGTSSGETIAYVPAAMGRLDDFILFLNNGGQSIGFLQVQYDSGQGLLKYIGNTAGGNMQGTCFLPLTDIDCGRVGQF